MLFVLSNKNDVPWKRAASYQVQYVSCMCFFLTRPAVVLWLIGKTFGHSDVWKWKVTPLYPTLCDPMDYTIHGILQARTLEWGSLSLLQGIFPTQGSNPGLPLQVDSLPAEPQGKPNTVVGSLSLLQGIFPTQQLNQGLLHHRRILYQLTYQGSPIQMNMYIQFTNPSSQLSKPLDLPEL